MTDESKSNPEDIKKSLDDAVAKLDREKSVSEKWESTVSDKKEEWESLKIKIKERQHALKELVQEKKAGSIGQDEFEKKFREIQDELTKLEFQVYNMRLGTKIEL